MRPNIHIAPQAFLADVQSDEDAAIRELNLPEETPLERIGRHGFGNLTAYRADEHIQVAKDLRAASQYADEPEVMFTALVNAADELGEYSGAILRHVRRQMLRGEA